MDSDEDTAFGGSEDSASTMMFDSDHSILQMIKENDPLAITFHARGQTDYIQNMSDTDWEELGRDLSNNTHLDTLKLWEGALNDHKMSCLFRGLTSSSSIKDLNLYSNQSISISGVRSMVPFFQHSSKLSHLNLGGCNIRSEGFNLLLRSLCDGPIDELNCSNCGIESIEIGDDCIPKYLKHLVLRDNKINADGCRELAKLLQGRRTTLKRLFLASSEIDDDGVAILVDALQNNQSLTELELLENDGISKQGRIMLLKLVNDISSIEATLESNHTLEDIRVDIKFLARMFPVCPILAHIDEATRINSSRCNAQAVGKAKVVQTQLHSARRALLCRLQDVDHSVFSEIDPLHLPEVLALIDQYHGQGELFFALSSSIMSLFSIVNVKKCLQQQRAYYMSKVEELDAKLASMETEDGAAAGRNESDNNARGSNRVESVESLCNKRRRR